ncbi:MAG: type I DNA topoisomerase [Chloroflexota bacterium]|nr:type I DNA topoisomerase [Dehalococcoidia bacterium]MDW8253659.1 type I DNA topoisomerase [Chloroflexota bacterium]
MAKDLVIVESPTKAKTLSRFLGARYSVRASLGHVRDLPKSQLGVDVEHDFAPKYLVPREKKELIKELREAVKEAPSVWLATDPDREGEAISWHLAEATGVDPAKVRRVVFHEITKEAVTEAFRHPRTIDMELVNAQQARRILDRLVGYELSPLLWRKVKGRLSAGRVQSVAVRLIVDREREIAAFVPTEYWTIDADLTKQQSRSKRDQFRASLIGQWGQREKLTIPNEERASALVADLRPATFTVAEVRRREVQRQPAPPFTTSTLQQEAARKLRFTAKRTMLVAQQLYEGIYLPDEGESVGLITYMRTDSTHVAESAQQEARRYIAQKFGGDFVPAAPRVFTKKARNAQEAHEAIRPTSTFREPERIKAALTPEQYRLYELIWKRFVASQMEAATLDTTTVEIRASDTPSGTDYLLRASGSVIKFPGFLELYRESTDEEGEVDDEGKRPLPALQVGDQLDLVALVPEQHFTQPPPRYTEASLVKALEEQGIGRPSTYAPIISTIIERGYVKRVDRRLVPTELGVTVNDLLVTYFPNIVDVGFTAQLEEQLDDIANGEREWVPVLRDFYLPFHREVERAAEAMPTVKVEDEPYGEDCDKCGRPLVIKRGRFGRFIACSGFPTCRNAKPLLEKVGVRCPACAEGELVVRSSKKGRTFYGCDRYPACTFTVWDRPLPEPCPNCGGFQVQTASGARCLTENPVIREPAPAAAAQTSPTGSAAKQGAGSTTSRRTSRTARSSRGDRTPAGARR